MSLRRTLTATASASLILAASATAQQSDTSLAAEVDAIVQTILDHKGVPGLAIAVVEGDRPTLLKGYGYADVERRIPVTEHTGFYIASITKAFTALTLTLMDERGEVDLDAPVTRYLPGVQWADSVYPDSITLRRLLSHTHGLAGDGPVVWRTAYTGEQTNPLLKTLIRYHGPSGSGHRFRYTNVGYNIAGLVIDELTRGRWQDALQSRLFRPLGMTRTSAMVSRFDSTDLSQPYTLDSTGFRRLRYGKFDGNMQAAGGLISTAHDLARWLEMQMNGGKLDGRQVIPAAVLAETQRIHAPASDRREHVELIGYSLGWMIGVQGSDTVLTHGGGFSAFRALVVFSPRHRVGVAVLASEARVGGGAIDLLARYMLDRVRDGAAARESWQPRLAAIPSIIERIRGQLLADRERRAARPQVLPHPMETYTGTFVSEESGTLRWTVRDGRLYARIGGLESVADVFNSEKDELRVELEPGSGTVAQFRIEDGRAVAVVLNGSEYRRQ